jgi:prepilin peptidase CpaA
MTTDSFPAAASVVFALLLGAVCISDVRARRIPNALVLATALLGVVYSLASAPWVPGAAKAFGGLAVGLAIWLPFYALRVLGAGDVKFFAAASAWLGAGAAVEAALIAAVLGGLLSAVWIIREQAWWVTLVRGAQMRLAGVRDQTPDAAKRSRLPYGVAMAGGLAVAAWWPILLS